MKSSKIIYFIFFCIVILFYSCQPEINFKKTKEGEVKSLTSIEKVTSYKLRFNPKANGAINISLESGTEYMADKLNSSQLSSILTLLQTDEIQFDTENEEFILNK